MQNVFYKVAYKENNIPVFNSFEDINEAINFYKVQKKLGDVKFFVVNNVEQELTEDQFPEEK